MREAERRGLPYLFKLRLTANVKKLIKKTFSKDDWTNAGQGWQGREGTLLRLELEPSAPGRKSPPVKEHGHRRTRRRGPAGARLR